MTAERWQRIIEQVALGDPLKDIGCDALELFGYCETLREVNDRLIRRVMQLEAASILHRATSPAHMGPSGAGPAAKGKLALD